MIHMYTTIAKINSIFLFSHQNITIKSMILIPTINLHKKWAIGCFYSLLYFIGSIEKQKQSFTFERWFTKPFYHLRSPYAQTGNRIWPPNRSTFMIKALQRAAVCPTIIQCESHLNIDNSQSKLPDTQQVWSGFVLKWKGNK